MREIGRDTVFGKLNEVGYQAIDSATKLCEIRQNPYVELVHWINQILQLTDSDLHRIVDTFHIDNAHLAADLTHALDALPKGATAVRDFSPHVLTAIKEGWLYATLMYNDPRVRTGYLLVGILKDESLHNVLFGISKLFRQINLDELTEGLRSILQGSPEDNLGAKDGSDLTISALAGGAEDTGAPSEAMEGKRPALEKFSIDLTGRARTGDIDPVVGRDDEIRQIVDILMRRRQNNPILTGEAGVGKTAVVEGFALRIAAGDVPPMLKDVTLRTLDLGALQAGAGVRGEFENRLRQVIQEVQSSVRPIILFIDEAHTLVGAGGTAGTSDAANLLKPALARGTLRTIAATTWAEYKQYFETDAALSRRFQVVQVNEPSEEKAIRMMRGLATTLEGHHKVQIMDEALASAVTLSRRYIPSRQLPDKAVSLLDTASARVAVSQHAIPPELDDAQKQVEALQIESEIIGREAAIGIDVTEREAEASAALETEKQRVAQLTERWSAEKTLVNEILGLHAQLRGDELPADQEAEDQPASELEEEVSADAEKAAEALQQDREALLARLQELQEELDEIQGETPLLLPSVDSQAVATIVADWTGVPVGRMVKNEIEAVLKLAATLQQRVIGQDHAMKMIARRIETSRAGLDNPNKPIGVFLLCGPSGVGKTETGLALAEALYGGEENIITINMSEFQEAHTVSTLKGAPPGYKGYGKGGILTEAVRRRPYSVILLDEVEKAHSDVHEIFFQVFDKGRMDDSEGRRIDFRNTLILLTSNVGTDLIMSMCKDPELMPDTEGLTRSMRPSLLKVFPPALLGRLVTIPYYPLGDEMLNAIIRLQLGRIEKRITEQHKVPFSYNEEVVKLITSRCTEVESGARMVDSILTNTLLPALSSEILKRTLEGQELSKVEITVSEGDLSYAFD